MHTEVHELGGNIRNVSDGSKERMNGQTVGNGVRSGTSMYGLSAIAGIEKWVNDPERRLASGEDRSDLAESLRRLSERNDQFAKTR